MFWKSYFHFLWVQKSYLGYTWETVVHTWCRSYVWVYQIVWKTSTRANYTTGAFTCGGPPTEGAVSGKDIDRVLPEYSNFSTRWVHELVYIQVYDTFDSHQTSNIRRSKSQHLNVSRCTKHSDKGALHSFFKWQKLNDNQILHRKIPNIWPIDLAGFVSLLNETHRHESSHL